MQCTDKKCCSDDETNNIVMGNDIFWGKKLIEMNYSITMGVIYMITVFPFVIKVFLRIPIKTKLIKQHTITEPYICPPTKKIT